MKRENIVRCVKCRKIYVVVTCIIWDYTKSAKSLGKHRSWEHKIGVCWAAGWILTYMKGELNDSLQNRMVMWVEQRPHLEAATSWMLLWQPSCIPACFMFFILCVFLQSTYHPTDALHNATHMTYINCCMFRLRGAINRELLQPQVYKPTCHYTFCSLLWT